MSLLDRERIVQSFFPSKVFLCLFHLNPCVFVPLGGHTKSNGSAISGHGNFWESRKWTIHPFHLLRQLFGCKHYFFNNWSKIEFSQSMKHIFMKFFPIRCHQTEMVMKWQIQLHWFCLILTLPTHTQNR